MIAGIFKQWKIAIDIHGKVEMIYFIETLEKY